MMVVDLEPVGKPKVGLAPSGPARGIGLIGQGSAGCSALLAWTSPGAGSRGDCGEPYRRDGGELPSQEPISVSGGSTAMPQSAESRSARARTPRPSPLLVADDH